MSQVLKISQVSKVSQVSNMSMLLTTVLLGSCSSSWWKNSDLPQLRWDMQNILPEHLGARRSQEQLLGAKKVTGATPKELRKGFVVMSHLVNPCLLVRAARVVRLSGAVPGSVVQVVSCTVHNLGNNLAI